jgi:hypothetical protein
VLTNFNVAIRTLDHDVEPAGVHEKKNGHDIGTITITITDTNTDTITDTNKRNPGADDALGE